MHDAKTQLSRLVDRAAGGETIVIARSGRPVARLTALESTPVRSRIGGLAGHASIPDDFDRMGAEEIEEMFGLRR
ncbi:MAG: type II toxin-antitoxin system prevent-host-death family antitoxin [Micrococcales bacterium]|nr:type II toxin-antitoxin system prevent-host-death family antitoxin [Micrococcales bacterium]